MAGPMRRTRATLEPHVDARRFDEVSQVLAIQEREAKGGRNANVSSFRTFADRALPAGEPEPPYDLDHYRALSFPFAPGNTH